MQRRFPEQHENAAITSEQRDVNLWTDLDHKIEAKFSLKDLKFGLLKLLSLLLRLNFNAKEPNSSSFRLFLLFWGCFKLYFSLN